MLLPQNLLGVMLLQKMTNVRNSSGVMLLPQNLLGVMLLQKMTNVRNSSGVTLLQKISMRGTVLE